MKRDKNNRVETVYEVPRAVIAEAVINAIVHRDYYSKASIKISVFSDRIEMTDPENPNSLKQKYRLTKVGIEFKKKCLMNTSKIIFNLVLCCNLQNTSLLT